MIKGVGAEKNHNLNSINHDDIMTDMVDHIQTPLPMISGDFMNADSTSQSPTDSCRTHRNPEDSPGFLRIPQDSSIILVILSW